MKKVPLFSLLFILSYHSFGQITSYDDGLIHSERMQIGYFNKIPKSGIFTYTGYDVEGEYAIYFFKSKSGQLIDFGELAIAIQKKYDLTEYKKYLNKNFNITWKMTKNGPFLLSASVLSNNTNAQRGFPPKKLQYLLESNAGMLGFYDDSTVVSCPRCDFNESNVKLMATKKSIAKFNVVDDYIKAIINGGEQRFMLYEEGKVDTQWVMFNFKWIRKP